MKPFFTLATALAIALAACQPTLVMNDGSPSPTTPAINFGDDSSTWAFDGECDDPRFQGSGMANAGSLTSANQFRDASDCRNLFNAGRITLRTGPVVTPTVPTSSGINFGNDTSTWAFDGECDDPRFQGSGMAAASSLTSSNQFRDATDCRNLFNAGRVRLRTGGPVTPAPIPVGPSVNFGDDSSRWAFDGECDDPRFQGVGMAAAGSLTSANRFRDATDCRNLFNAGRVILSGTSTPIAINFGSDSSVWAFDGECDDPRFSGPGMAAASTLSSTNIGADATDCRSLFNAGRIF